ncbi:hypothetical protein BMT54_08175 [Pasteurellaceae bacterium 15-036681]|nr:hypothetical protein BMT54_08175 [Pasteurellaceae bacterium 15-036681]
MQQGFSKFSWALALFCVPSALWPLALLVSPKFSDNPNLTSSQIDWFSIAFWIYPLVLFALAGIFYKVYQNNKNLGRGLLAVGFVGFYGLVSYIFKTV